MNPNLNRAPLRAALLSALASLVFAAGVAAQSNTHGSLVGRASAGDTVTVANPKTGFIRTLEVGAKGRYRVNALPVGVYNVTVMHEGVVVLNKPVAVHIGQSALVTPDKVK